MLLLFDQCCSVILFNEKKQSVATKILLLIIKYGSKVPYIMYLTSAFYLKVGFLLCPIGTKPWGWYQLVHNEEDNTGIICYSQPGHCGHKSVFWWRRGRETGVTTTFIPFSSESYWPSHSFFTSYTILKGELSPILLEKAWQI